VSDAFIVAVGCTAFGDHSASGFRELTADVLGRLKDDAGIDIAHAVTSELDSLWFGSCFMDAWGQSNIRGQVSIVDLVEAGALPARVPVYNVEGACATGSLALHGSIKDVLSGQSSLSLAIGVEKLRMAVVDGVGSNRRSLELFDGCTDNVTHHRLIGTYAALASQLNTSFDPGPKRSLFMDTYALQAHEHMARYGTTREQIAAACAKNHNYGADNELAQYRYRTTADEVLADREIAFPLTRSMCSPIGDGAAAALVASGDWLAGQPSSVRDRAIRVRAIGTSGGTYKRTAAQPTLSFTAAQRAYERAGLSPRDIDVAEVHDATSFGEILQAEMLGFCERGQGGAFVAAGATGPGGPIPINTSGGLVSKGHPVGATGLSMVYELTRQLRGEAGIRQVPDARIGLAENGGGVIGLEEAICAVTILERPS
jgi:acetyl-CoA acetyltransferase